MKGYQHFLFSLLFAASLLWPLSAEDVVLALLFSLGALLPDLDAEYSTAKGGRIKYMPRVVSVLLRLLSLSLAPFLFIFGGKHRGCFHSFYAALVVFLWLYFLSTLIGLPWQYSGAVALGFVAHILEDGATPSGVRPLCSFTIRGKLMGWRYLILNGALLVSAFLLFSSHPWESLLVLLLSYASAFL